MSQLPILFHESKGLKILFSRGILIAQACYLFSYVVMVIAIPLLKRVMMEVRLRGLDVECSEERMRFSWPTWRLVFLIFLEAESCHKLLQSNPHATNGIYQIAVHSITTGHSIIFPVSVIFIVLSKTHQETAPFAKISLQNWKREIGVEWKTPGEPPYGRVSPKDQVGSDRLWKTVQR